ncbi:copper chaperone PCu(A)C [Streptomyces sp. RB6PN25]|uniref:Copper chaperone PCu(A)C n=1 Tax=Streptomyces humicola TaxID=2953240 RepID=A0ABT1PTR4_9ACTN|nr:copper chaperone PCu(A)C [Streptomyces humicola]MCQ4081064.1 copper chaperone PCu(A)C [Streptomyces humicola]
MKNLAPHVAVAVATLVVGATALTGCSTSSSAASPAGGSPELKVTGAYVPQPPMADMAAGYFAITNSGTAPDRLTGVTSDIASDVSMHTTTASDQMKPVASFTIPAGGRLVLSTGGNHLMLMGLKHKPVAGQAVAFHLRFATSAPITVRAPVEPATYQPKG